MAKRDKRAMDNAKFLALKERGDKPDKKLQEQAKQYTILNNTLKSELPKLFVLTAKLISVCLERFMQLQMQWQDIWQIKIKQVLDNQRVPKNVLDIMAQFATDFQFVEGPIASLSITSGLSSDRIISKSLSPSTDTTTDDLSLKHSNTRDSTRSIDRERIVSLNSTLEGTRSIERDRITSLSSSQGRMTSSHLTTTLSIPAVRSPAEITSGLSLSNDLGAAPSYFPPQPASSPYQPAAYAAALRNSFQSLASRDSPQSSLPLQSTGPHPIRTNIGGIISPPATGRPSNDAHLPQQARDVSGPPQLQPIPFQTPLLQGAYQNVTLPLQAAPISSATATTTSTSAAAAAAAPAQPIFTSALPPSSSTESSPTDPHHHKHQHKQHNQQHGLLTPPYSSSSQPPAVHRKPSPGAAATATPGGTLSPALHPSNPPPAHAGTAAAQPTLQPASSAAPSTSRSRTPQLQPPSHSPSPPGPAPTVLFLAASLFEFNIDRERKEAGYPYLTYVPGEIFDIVGIRGELWLSRNQDDPAGNLGWIWTKHFAKLSE